MLNINIIKHIALALVASSALAGGAHAQAGKKEQEPIFDGSFNDFTTLIDVNGGERQYAQARIGQAVVLSAHFGSATVNEPLFFDKSKKKTGTIVIRGKPIAGRSSQQALQCHTDDLNQIQRLATFRIDQEIRIRANIVYSHHIDKLFLDSCQVL